MALAILKYKGKLDNRLHFDFQSGSNSFYSYLIGNDTRKRGGGNTFIAEPSYQSPIMGPLRPSLHPWRQLVVDPDLIDRDNNLIQLFTFNTRDRAGPAFSQIVQVRPGLEELGDLPSIQFSKSFSIMDQIPVQQAPFPYRELTYSQQMGLWDVISNIGSIVSKALPVARTIFSGGGNGAATGGSVTNLLGNTDFQSQIRGLLQNLGVRPDANFISSLTGLLQNLTPAAASAAVAQQSSLSHSCSCQHNHGTTYAEAQALPIAAIAQLLPMLSQMITPEVLQSVVNAPNQLTGTVLNAANQALGNIITGANEAANRELQHLENLHPTLDDPSIVQLLNAMSFSLEMDKAIAIPFRKIGSVNLNFTDTRPIPIMGVEKVVYNSQQDLQLSVQLQSPRPIPKAIAQLIVKNPENLEILFQKKYRLRDLEPGMQLPGIGISREEMQSLPKNSNLLFCLSLIWKNRRNKKIGTVKNHMITLTDEYVVDHVAGRERMDVPLNDVVEHRDFWHKIWNGGNSQSRRWSAVFDAKYYFALDPKEDRISLGETRIKKLEDNVEGEEDVPRRRELRAKIKSGMKLSLNALNSLLPRISSYPILNESQLKALATEDFAAHYHLAARSQLEFKGRQGESASLWIYPEVNIHRIVLRRIGATDAQGQVSRFDEEIVFFPIVSSAHFIGTKSER